MADSESGSWRLALVVGSGGRKWIKAAPTLLPVLDPSGKRSASLSDGGKGEDLVRAEACFVGSEGRVSGQGKAMIYCCATSENWRLGIEMPHFPANRN